MKKKYNLGKLAATLKKMRATKDLSRDELARQAKVNYNTIIKLESGANKNPTVKTLIGIAQVFDTTVEDLISAA
ncbi:helix-turn-helix transcriptional regulator [Patescibacteria group bacterium]|nr:helix-turn-helix transcriptional regulator [Patescibacteria group bacterium]